MTSTTPVPPNTRCTSSPLHVSERAIHARLGITEGIEHLGSRTIHDYLAEQHLESTADSRAGI